MTEEEVMNLRNQGAGGIAHADTELSQNRHWSKRGATVSQELKTWGTVRGTSS